MGNGADQATGWHLPAIDPIAFWIIASLLSLSGILVVMEALGFLPARMSSYLNKNRLAQTLETLKAMGIDVEAIKRRNTVVGLPERTNANTLKERIASRFKSISIEGPLFIGTTEVARGHKYIDLMGATTDPAVAVQFARDLAAHWRNLIDERKAVVDYEIDFVVTPKSGSPFLGYEFARLLGLPFMVHNADLKFRRDPDIAEAHFDCRSMPAKGARGLLVDDSSTGGGKARQAIDDLRRFDFVVSDFLVVFAPAIKRANGQDAETRLKAAEVNLHWIVET